MTSATPEPMKSMVVAAASRHGSTREIADRVAERLSHVLPQWRVTRVDLGDQTWPERLLVKVVHAMPGDHRDWDGVDAWAGHIAAELGGG